MGINAFIQGFVTVAIAVIGLYFSWESRRADNYQAVADLALSGDPNVAATAAETMELMTVDCRGEAATDLQAQRIRDIFCPLSTHHRFILNNMIAAIREAERAEMMATLEAVAEEAAPVDVASETSASFRTSSSEPQDDVCDPAEGVCVTMDPIPVEDTGPDPRIQTLLADINDSSRTTRRSATAAFEREFVTSPDGVEALVDQIAELENLEGLSAQGRFNVLYLLNRVPAEVWRENPATLERALSSIGQIREREKRGIAVGDQTRAVMQELEARLRDNLSEDQASEG